MSVVVQTVVVGLSAGAVYALVAVGFTLAWSLTRTLAFAHGDVVVASVLLAVLAVVGATPVAAAPGALTSLGLVLLALLFGGALSAVAYVVGVRPFLADTAVADGSTDLLGWVAGAVTAGLVIRTTVAVALPASGYAVPDPLHLDGLTSSGVVRLPGGATVPVRVLGVLLVGVAVAVATDRFLAASRLGLAMRAVADRRDAAALCGVPVGRVVLIAFVLAGILAAVAGLLAAPDRAVTPDSGVVLGLDGAAAALLGGLGSARGALLGGLVLGLVQQAVIAIPALGAQWSDVAPLTVLVVVLAVRPYGLGRPRRVPVE